MKIAELQCWEYISVLEVTMLYGVSKDTVYRMIRKGVVLGINLGERLTRVRKSDFDNLFIGSRNCYCKTERRYWNFYNE